MQPSSLCADDKEEEIDQVIGRYAEMVYRLAVAQVHTAADADDVFQEVFLRYIRKPRRFESEEHRKAWFIRVTINCGKNFWSAAWRRKTVPLQEELSFEMPEDQGLFEALHSLPSKYAAILHLFYYEDLPVETISRMLQLRPSTIRSQLTRGRALLRQQLKEDDEAVEKRIRSPKGELHVE